MFLNKYLTALISFLLVAQHYIFLKFQTNKNKLEYGKRFLPLASKIKINGKNNKIILGDDVKLQNTRIKIQGSNNVINLLDGVRIYESCEFLIEGDNCEISIGNFTTIGSANIFCGESNTKIMIGNNCMLSRLINIDTSDFHSIIDLSTQKRINQPKNVFIGNKVWIGYNSTINKGAIINNNTIIATKSIIAGREYSQNVIIGGVPAKVIRENITWSREKLPY